MSELNEAQQAVFDRLGAPPDSRPHFEPGLRDELRIELESGLAPVVARLTVDTLVLSKAVLEGVHGCEARFMAQDDFAWTPAMARGVVAHKAIELTISRRIPLPPLDMVDEALAVLTADGYGVGDWLQRADEATIDSVRADANTYLCKFLDCWPPISRAWRPATEASIRAELFEGRVVLSGRPDLTIGRSEGTRAGKVIIDFKTGGFAPAHRADLRFYALVDTLRTGTPPRLVATSYLDTARLEPENVTVDLLHAEVRRTVDAGHKIVALRAGEREANRHPGAACRWCPLAEDCEPGQAHLAELDDQW